MASGKRGNPTWVKGGPSPNPSGRSRTDAVKVSAMDGFINLATGLGITGRDKTRGTVHETDIVTPEDGLDLWRGNDVAARMVETVVDEACRVGFDFQVTNKEDKSPQPAGPPNNLKRPAGPDGKGQVLPFKRKDAELEEEAVEGEETEGPDAEEKPDDDAKDLGERMAEAWEKLGLLELCREAGHHQRAAGGGALLLGADDGVRDLAAPLALERVSSFDWINFLECTELTPEYWYNDPRKPNYRKVAIWRLQPSQPGPSLGGEDPSQQILVHESRLVVFQGIQTSRIHNMPSRTGWGDNIFTRTRQVLSDYQLTWASIMVLLQEEGMAIFKMKGLAEAFAQDNGAPLRKRLEAMAMARATTNTTVIDGGEDGKAESFERIAVPLTGVADIIQQMLQRVAASADLTVAELFGVPPSGLNTSGASDATKKYEKAGTYQRRWVIPAFRRVSEILLALWKEKPDAYTVKPRPLQVPTDLERSTILLNIAQVDEKNIASGVYTPEEAAASRYGGDEFSMDINIDFEAREQGIPAAPGPAKTEQQLEQEAAEKELATAELEIAAKKAEPRPLAKRDNLDCDNPTRDGDGRFTGCASGGGGGGGGRGGGAGAGAASLSKQLEAHELPTDLDEIEALVYAEHRLRLASYNPDTDKFAKVSELKKFKTSRDDPDPYDVEAPWTAEQRAARVQVGLAGNDPAWRQAAVDDHLAASEGDRSYSPERQAAAVEAYKQAHEKVYAEIRAARDRSAAHDKVRETDEGHEESGVDVPAADRLLKKIAARLGRSHEKVAKTDGDDAREDCANPSRDGDGRFTGCLGGGGGGKGGGGSSGGAASPSREAARAVAAEQYVETRVTMARDEWLAEQARARGVANEPDVDTRLMMRDEIADAYARRGQGDIDRRAAREAVDAELANERAMIAAGRVDPTKVPTKALDDLEAQAAPMRAELADRAATIEARSAAAHDAFDRARVHLNESDEVIPSDLAADMNALNADLAAAAGRVRGPDIVGSTAETDFASAVEQAGLPKVGAAGRSAAVAEFGRQKRVALSEAETAVAALHAEQVALHATLHARSKELSGLRSKAVREAERVRPDKLVTVKDDHPDFERAFAAADTHTSLEASFRESLWAPGDAIATLRESIRTSEAMSRVLAAATGGKPVATYKPAKIAK